MIVCTVTMYNTFATTDIQNKIIDFQSNVLKLQNLLGGMHPAVFQAQVKAKNETTVASKKNSDEKLGPFSIYRTQNRIRSTMAHRNH